MSVGFGVISRFILHTGDLCLFFCQSCQKSVLSILLKSQLFVSLAFEKSRFQCWRFLSRCLLPSLASLHWCRTSRAPWAAAEATGEAAPPLGARSLLRLPLPPRRLSGGPHILPCCIFAFIHFHAFTSSGTSFVTRGWLRRALSVPRCLRISPPPSGY